MDAQGIAIIITAVGTFLGTAVGLWIKLQEVHKLVNSVAESLKERAKELSDALVEIARLKGLQEGIEAERAAPLIPATIVDETVLTKEKELTEAKKAELLKKKSKKK